MERSEPSAPHPSGLNPTFVAPRGSGENGQEQARKIPPVRGRERSRTVGSLTMLVDAIMTNMPDPQTLATLVSNVTETMCGISFEPSKEVRHIDPAGWRLAI